MQEWVIQEWGRQGLRLRDHQPREPGPGELRLEILAASLNYRDHLMVEGLYDPRQPRPLVPLSDAVGRVTACGEGVEGWEVGDRACPLFAQEWLSGPLTESARRSTLGGPLPGVMQPEMVLPAASLVRPPEDWTDAEAACLPCAWLTAWSALEQAEQPAKTVLILGTGGVALAAHQLAKARGAKTLILSGSPEKLEALQKRDPADWVGNRRELSRWGAAARQQAAEWGQEGVDQVIELGGAGSLAQSLRALRPQGTISLIGVLAGGQAPLNLTPVLMRQIRIQGVFVGSRSRFEDLCDFLRAHPMRPWIHRRYPWEDLPAALEDLARGQHMGKLVLVRPEASC